MLLIGVLLAAGALVALRFLRVPRNANEPPYIPSRIPYIGHLVGLFKSGMRYYSFIKYVETHRSRVNISASSMSIPSLEYPS